MEFEFSGRGLLILSCKDCLKDISEWNTIFSLHFTSAFSLRKDSCIKCTYTHKCGLIVVWYQLFRFSLPITDLCGVLFFSFVLVMPGGVFSALTQVSVPLPQNFTIPDHLFFLHLLIHIVKAYVDEDQFLH